MTASELIERLGHTVSRQRLHQLRNGYTSKGIAYPPVLVEGTDWRWLRGRIIYYETAIGKIQKGK